MGNSRSKPTCMTLKAGRQKAPQPVAEPLIKKSEWQNTGATMANTQLLKKRTPTLQSFLTSREVPRGIATVPRQCITDDDYYDTCRVPTIDIGVLCDACGKSTSFSKSICRVCAIVYHPDCLEGQQLCVEDANKAKQATSDIGWSCTTCANIAVLLTEEQNIQLNEDFDRYKINRGVAIGEKAFIEFAKKVHKQNHGRAMTPEAEVAERTLFHRMDVDSNGEINYWEFLEYNGCKIIQERTPRELVNMLSPFEIWHAREVYDVRFNTDYMIDNDSPEYEYPFRGWYKHMDKIRKARNDSTNWQETTQNRIAFPSECMAPWMSYLESQAMRIISSRPNYK